MNPHVVSSAIRYTKRLNGSWNGRYGFARCPVHDDSEPSLSITPGDKAVLFHCFAGCSSKDIAAFLYANRIYEPIDGRADTSVKPQKDLTELAREIWSGALPIAGTPVERYLQRRCIEHSTIARYDPAAVTYLDNKRVRHPAMLLPVHEGRDLVAVQRHFLEPDGSKSTRFGRKNRRMLSAPKGGAVRIGARPGDILNLAEGYEDAESVIVIKGLDHCWAACGIDRYRHIAIPPNVRLVRIWSQHGRPASTAIAASLDHLTDNGRELCVELPPPGGDWNDLLMAQEGTLQELAHGHR